MQTDFCGSAAMCDKMGLDVAHRARRSRRRRACWRAMRAAGLHDHPHPRGPPARPLRPPRQQALALARGSAPGSATPGPCGRMLTRGEPGWEIMPELAPLARGNRDRQARQRRLPRDRPRSDPARRGIRNLVFAGVTSDCCVHTTMTNANDKGYECLLLADASAPPIPPTTRPRCT